MSENELFKIPEEALKKNKSEEEFIQRLYKQGVEALINAEINEHLSSVHLVINPEQITPPTQRTRNFYIPSYPWLNPSHNETL